ncbi:ArsR/SmtB family transcription factor, partial [Bacillus thuringiensis]
KKSTLSHHYKVLRESGIIALRIQGRHYYYSVREADLNNRFPTLLSLILTTPSSDI